MLLKLRPTPYALYRLFFVMLIYGLGILGLCNWILEKYLNVHLVIMNTVTSYEALLATSLATGIAGIIAGSIMLGLLRERRIFVGDRRQTVIEIDFPDRRKRDRRRTA